MSITHHFPLKKEACLSAVCFSRTPSDREIIAWIIHMSAAGKVALIEFSLIEIILPTLPELYWLNILLDQLLKLNFVKDLTKIQQ